MQHFFQVLVASNKRTWKCIFRIDFVLTSQSKPVFQIGSSGPLSAGWGRGVEWDPKRGWSIKIRFEFIKRNGSRCTLCSNCTKKTPSLNYNETKFANSERRREGYRNCRSTLARDPRLRRSSVNRSFSNDHSSFGTSLPTVNRIRVTVHATG